MKNLIYTRKEKIFYGIGVDTVGSLLATIIGFAVMPLYFNYISVEQFGTWLVVSGLVAFITTADISSDQYLITVVADNSIFEDTKICDLITATILVKLLTAVIFIIVGAILYAALDSLVTLDAAYEAEAKSAFMFAIVVLIVTMMLSTIPSILTGRNHLSLVNGLNAFSAIFTSIATLLLLKIGKGIIAFPLAMLISNLAQNGVLIFKLLKLYPHLHIKFRGFKFPNKKEIFGYSISLQLLRWTHTLRTQYIIIAINNLIGPGAVTLYNMTLRLPAAIAGYGSKVPAALFPSLAEYFAEKRIDLAREAFLKVTKLLVRFSIHMGITLYFVGDNFVNLWVGPDKFAGEQVLLLLIINMIVIVGMGAFGIVVFASKEFKNWNLWSIIELLASIGLSYYLSFNYGLAGVVAGFVLGSYFTILYLFKLVLGQLDLSLLSFFKRIGHYSLVPNAVVLLVGFLIFEFYSLRSWFDFFVYCSLMIIVQLASWEGIKMIFSKESGLSSKLKDAIRL